MLVAPDKATAIVLRVVEFSETSSIVTLFTRECGKVRAMAKGARRPKGPFESSLDLLSLCNIVFIRKSSDALDLLTEAKLERRFRPPGRELAPLYAAYYLAELLNEFTDDYDQHPELFDLANQTLLELGSASATEVRNLVLRFELMLLDLLGHMPSLDLCADCGVKLPEQPRVAFSQLSGGVLCKDCRIGKKQVISVSTGVLAVLKQFADANSPHWRSVPIDPRYRGELRAILNHYFAHLLGHRPRMQSYLGILSN